MHLGEKAALYKKLRGYPGMYSGEGGLYYFEIHAENHMIMRNTMHFKEPTLLDLNSSLPDGPFDLVEVKFGGTMKYKTNLKVK